MFIRAPYKTINASVYAIDSNLIEVKVDVAPIQEQDRRYTTVGLLKAAVRKRRERVRLALKNSGSDAVEYHHSSRSSRLAQGRLRL